MKLFGLKTVVIGQGQSQANYVKQIVPAQVLQKKEEIKNVERSDESKREKTDYRGAIQKRSNEPM